jgi:hypothetical protein
MDLGRQPASGPLEGVVGGFLPLVGTDAGGVHAHQPVDVSSGVGLGLEFGQDRLPGTVLRQRRNRLKTV